MSRKINYKSVSPFHDRLYELLGEDTQRWAKKLGISKGTITNVWFKGSYPGADKIIKICEETGRSADWLLFGTETEKDCPVDCKGEMIGICKDVKELIESGEHWGLSLEANIKSFKAGYDNDKKIDELEQRINNWEKTNSEGQKSDTPIKPAESTG